MLALGIRYLTGYAVATDVTSRERAEWPPHPARVYMAMAAAYFETKAGDSERTTLEWLERLGPPRLAASEAEPRRVVKQFVPVNDKPGPAKMALQCLPTLTRHKAERTFPCMRPHDDCVYLIWPDAEPNAEHRAAFARLCSEVTRIGHSSSLVQMWVEDSPPPWRFEPGEEGSEQLRSVSEGTLAYLEHQFEAGGGLRPTISTWQPYRRVADREDAAEEQGGPFDPEFQVLTIQDGPMVGLESTWRLATCLHKTILETCDPTPEWVSGHDANGRPSEQPHLALLPLAFAGVPHADGHLMGFALVFPRGVSRRERGHALGRLLHDGRGLPRDVDLRAGRLGRWLLAPELRHEPPRTLRSATWTRASDTWATITPIVLDRHPRAGRAKDREAWSLEVADIIADSCEVQGLPRPVAVDVDRTAWHSGVPRAVSGQGTGFPLMPVKSGRPQRQQTHAWIRFAQPVVGPLVIGAGRYRGYGFCRPWKRGRR